MLKTFLLFLILFLLFFVPPAKAAGNNFVSVVNPVRGNDFWENTNQKPSDAVKGQIELLQKNQFPATFLVRFDALSNQEILSVLNSTNFEKGLFLEMTPSLTSSAGVNYNQSQSWHFAQSVLVTGYSPGDRIKLIDKAFEKFKSVYGFYPKSVGAWWIDAGSLEYMQTKYGIETALVVADQYSTDGYQIWGQYWSTPYYPAKNNALFPAQEKGNKINIVMTQWASRDPVNGYGRGVEESTLSLQANDYLDYHNLSTDYFSKLVDIYTTQKFNQFGQIIVGLENSYSWNRYKSEYQKQLEVLKKKQDQGQFQVVTLEDFAKWYKLKYPGLSPEQLIYADDPLGSSKKAIWFMNNYYRIGWISNNEGSIIRDLRQYVNGQDEICLSKACKEVNFATFATRVLDQVTYGQKILIDQGPIVNFQLTKHGEDFNFGYQNSAGKQSLVKLLLKDIDINGKVSSIDGLILENIDKRDSKVSVYNGDSNLKQSLGQILFNELKFFVFVLFLIFLPGFIISRLIKNHMFFSSRVFLSLVSGMILLTLVGFISQVILRNNLLIYLYLLIIIILGFFNYKKMEGVNININKQILIIFFVILVGSIFQTIPTFKSGLEFGYGVGFWGPNGHDGVWHLALINQLTSNVPPQNPILSGEMLKNYHYFYDLLLSIIQNFSAIPSADLLFRFFPFLFSVLLGLGTFVLIRLFFLKNIFLNSIFALYFVYFAGSFGWITDYFKNRTLNGESDFWANQAISFNLNPPFMISLLIVIAIVILISHWEKNRSFVTAGLLIICLSSLLQFKAYGSILCFLSLGILSLIKLFKKDISYLIIILISSFLSIILLIPSYGSLLAVFSQSSQVFIFSPLWFVHSMIDSPDRVGITRLTLTRLSGYADKNILKIAGSEAIGIILFILGNLGTRIIGLVYAARNRYFQESGYLFVVLISTFAIIIPLLFIQSGTPWNTIQFFYYFLFFSSIFAGVCLANIFRFKKIGVIVSLLILMLTPINCIAVAKGYLYPHPHAFISSEEIAGLNFLRNLPLGFVLLAPFDEALKKDLNNPLPILAYDSTAYVSAFSAKPSFVEDEAQQSILDNGNKMYKKRLIEAKDFFSGREKDWSNKFLKDNKIKYIYLPKIYGLTIIKTELNLKEIFANNELVIYQTMY